MSTTAGSCGTPPTSWGSSAALWSQVSPSGWAPPRASLATPPAPDWLAPPTLPGESECPLLSPDRYVLYGNHRDSWVHGAVDPSSGTAVLLELSRVLGTLLKKGEAAPVPGLGASSPRLPTLVGVLSHLLCLPLQCSLVPSSKAPGADLHGRQPWPSSSRLVGSGELVQW